MEDVLERWRSEKTAAFLSSSVAAVETDKKRAKLFKQMAKAAEEQAGILAKSLKPVPEFKPSLRAKLIASLLGTFGPRAMRPILSASKVRGISVYRGQTEGHACRLRSRKLGRGTGMLAAAPCALASSAPMTASSPIPVWSWV
jgi:hypothetical protein